MKKKVVLTGMRTTGVLHLGHYLGALKQWIDIQNSGEYTCYFLLADIQALTTHADKPELLTKSIKEVLLDWISVGLDPSLDNVHFVQQSQIPARYELSMQLGMVAKYGEVMRNPTLKDEMSRQQDASMGFIYYPVDQIADIHMVDPMIGEGSELLVPVGDDQLSHLELAREVVRRFNYLYGELFTECKALVGKIGRLIGTNGDAKMSKSIGNTINLTDSDEVINRAIDRMPIDPARSVHGGNSVPGTPDKAVAIIYHRAINSNLNEVNEIENLYRNAQIGDRDIKERLKGVVREFLEPIRQRRAEYKNVDLTKILLEGNEAASLSCSKLVAEVRKRMHLILP